MMKLIAIMLALGIKGITKIIRLKIVFFKKVNKPNVIFRVRKDRPLIAYYISIK